MISAIQPAGMDLIVKISLILITETRFVNGSYFGLRVTGCGVRVAGYGLRGTGCVLRVTGYGLRGTGCGLRVTGFMGRGHRAWCIEQDDLRPEYLSSDI